MKSYYSIKEVAALLKEPESTLRYWEDEFPEVINPFRKDKELGLIKPSLKDRKENKSSRKEFGIRYYSDEDVNDVRLIQYLIRDCRLTFDGVRMRLKNNKENAEKQAKLLSRLENIKAELKALGTAFNEAEKLH